MLEPLHIRISTNMFLFDKNVGNGPLIGLLCEIRLNFLSIINLIQLINLEGCAKLGESLFCLTTVGTPTYMISTARLSGGCGVRGNYSLSRRRRGSRRFAFQQRS